MSRTTIHTDAADAVTGIADGATVLVGGFGMAGVPTHLVDALIEQGAADPLLGTLDDRDRATLLAHDEDGGASLRFDVRLQGSGETAFLRYGRSS